MKRYLLLLSVYLGGGLLFIVSQPTLAAPVSQQNVQTLAGNVNGYAYAGYLQIPAHSSMQSIGPLFPMQQSCVFSGKTATSTADSLTLGSFAKSDTVIDQVVTQSTSSSRAVQSRSTLENVSLLSGLITAQSITSFVSSVGTKVDASSGNQSTFTNLEIAGVPFPVSPQPNTRVSLPGIGSITLNEQIGPQNSADGTQVSVNALDIQMDLINTLSLPLNTHIILGHVESGFVRTQYPAVIAGKAYGLFLLDQASDKVNITSGPWSYASVGCTGGDMTVSLDQTSLGSLASVATMQTRASGKLIAGGATVTSSSQLQTIHLLNHLITIDGITTSANANWQNKGQVSSNTTFLHASIGSLLLKSSPSPNTKILLAGLGYVLVNEQYNVLTLTGASASVIALDIYITATNSYNLPIGARIVVGHSSASVSTY